MDNSTPTRIVDTDLSGSVVRQRESVSVSLQIQIMLVLSGHPNGRATLAAMNADLKVLAGAGPAWTQRINKLASNAPGLDIFTEGYVIRDANGWQITDAGRKALQQMDTAPPGPAIEKPLTPASGKPVIALVVNGTSFPPKPDANVIKMDDWLSLPRRAILATNAGSC